VEQNAKGLVKPINGTISSSLDAQEIREHSLFPVSARTLESNQVVDGNIAVALAMLREHTVLDELRLKEAVGKQVDNDEHFNSLLSSLIEQGLVQKHSGTLTLDPLGHQWLETNALGLAVETEDASSDGIPTKPYEVAKLKMETKNLSVFQALRKIEKGEINLSPDFQRAFVWDKVRQSRLIESILIRIPLPAFYLDATDQVRWNVVDGLQRLTTLRNYCRTELFPLQGLQFLQELENKKFDELPAQYQVLIEDDTQLLFYNLMPGTPMEAKFTIFSRVNTGGLMLTAQEIRHALNQGKVTILLKHLANHAEFLSATQGVVESLRMSDQELVLRALAFMHLGIGTYKEFNELDAFLLEAMSKYNVLPTADLDKLANDFIESLVKVREIFGKYAFRKFTERGGRRSPLNKALFEAWIVCVRPHPCSALKAHKDKIIDGFIQLMSDSDFVRSISSSTGSSSAVSTRFLAIQALLDKVVK